jgi:hypothetical protein
MNHSALAATSTTTTSSATTTPFHSTASMTTAATPKQPYQSKGNTSNTSGGSSSIPVYSHWVSHHPNINNEILFLFNLHDALINESQHILAFDMNGLRWCIHNVELFVRIIMPKYFKSKFFPFLRELSLISFH